MIRVIIVEDDKLTRLGIISSVPWDEYHMKIVLDTGNPQKALEYLDSNQADLLLTDISMPIMSGIELIRHAKKRAPKLQFAVLTMHQNFDYIQEALRLGALDYICKSQLDQDEVKDIILQIKERYHSVLHTPTSSDRLSRFGACYVLVHLGSGSSPLEKIFAARPVMSVQLHEYARLYYMDSVRITESEIYVREQLESALTSNIPSDTMIIKLADADNFTDDTLLSLPWLQKDNLFYTFRQGYFCLKVSSLIGENMVTSYENYTNYKTDFLSLKWIFSHTLFENIMDGLCRDHIPYPKLVSLFFKTEIEMNQCYGFLIPQKPFILPDVFLSFSHARDWFGNAADKICAAIESHSYSPYVIECLSQAILIMQTEYDKPLFSDEIAKRVHLSRSYFCQLFKKLTKQSFNHFLRDIRLAKARELLAKTSLSIQEIAEKTGYPDEKYFSHLFHIETGRTPSIYRLEQKASGREEKA